MLNNQPHILQNRMYPLPSEEAGFETTKCCLLSMCDFFFSKRKGATTITVVTPIFTYSSRVEIAQPLITESICLIPTTNPIIPPIMPPTSSGISWDIAIRNVRSGFAIHSKVAIVAITAMTQMVNMAMAVKVARNTFIFRFFLMNGEGQYQPSFKFVPEKVPGGTDRIEEG